MTPVLLNRGTAGQPWGEKRNRKAPSVAGGAQEILYAVFSARETFGSPAQGGLQEISEVHTIVAVRLKPRMMILLKRKRAARSRVVGFVARPPSRQRGAL